MTKKEFKEKFYYLVDTLRQDISLYVDEMECANKYAGAFERIVLFVEKYLENW